MTQPIRRSVKKRAGTAKDGQLEALDVDLEEIDVIQRFGVGVVIEGHQGNLDDRVGPEDAVVPGDVVVRQRIQAGQVAVDPQASRSTLGRESGRDHADDSFEPIGAQVPFEQGAGLRGRLEGIDPSCRPDQVGGLHAEQAMVRADVDDRHAVVEQVLDQAGLVRLRVPIADVVVLRQAHRLVAMPPAVATPGTATVEGLRVRHSRESRMRCSRRSRPRRARSNDAGGR